MSFDQSTAVQLYGQRYFEEYEGQPYSRSDHWLSLFGGIADRLVSALSPTVVLDAGCALALLVESLRDRGVEAWGVDVSEYAISQARPDIQPYCTAADLVEPLPPHFPSRFDLVTCIEVLEHLEVRDVDLALDRITSITDQVLFASTPRHYDEPTHINVNPPEYWARKFAERGFVPNLDVDVTFVAPWAKLFTRSSRSLAEVVADYERAITHLREERDTLRAELINAAAAGELPLGRGRSEQVHPGAEPAELELTPTAMRAELRRLRELVGPSEASYTQLQLDLLATRDHARGAEAMVGDLRAELTSRMHGEHAQVQQQELERLRRLAAHREEMLASQTWRVGNAIVGPVSRLLRGSRPGPRP